MTVAQIERLRTFWVVKEDVEDEQQAPGGASLADLDMDDGGGQGVVPGEGLVGAGAGPLFWSVSQPASQPSQRLQPHA